MASGTNMKQEDYLELEKSCGTKKLSENEAKALINSCFGFELSRIKVLDKAGIDITPKGSRYLRLEDVERPPLYNATDWNYIRFDINTDCGSCYYEMINDSLYKYYC